jgi:hypothetical protein
MKFIKIYPLNFYLFIIIVTSNAQQHGAQISSMTRPSCKVVWISCECVFWWFSFAMGHVVGLSSKKHYETSHSQVKITFFSLLNIYIVLHNHLKSSIYIYMTFILFYSTT